MIVFERGSSVFSLLRTGDLPTPALVLTKALRAGARDMARTMRPRLVRVPRSVAATVASSQTVVERGAAWEEERARAARSGTRMV